MTPLHELLDQVRHTAAGDSDLDRLASAVDLAGQLTTQADEVVGHFVDAARRGGCSWADIGAVLGVSRQAAQQRDSARRARGGRPPGRPALATEGLRRVLSTAGAEAEQLQHWWIGTEHLLLALLSDDGGVARQALRQLEVDAGEVRAAVVRIIGTDVPGQSGDTNGALRLTPRVQQVLELARKKARKLHATQIGPEHVLLGLLAEGQGVAPQLLVELGVDLRDLRRRVLSLVGAG